VKIIDRYILTTYLTRLASVFFILMFIFIIQTFWLFIDEFAGKGLDAEIIFKFLTYYSPKLYPLVMPLSVLLASIMTYGTFAENYEFAAMKSTGISLQRALLGLTIFHFFLGVGSYYFSNNVIPYGEFKYFNLRRNLAKLKPALAITEGIFNEIGEMNIKVTRKYGENNRFLEDVIIHEKSPDNQNRTEKCEY
jgi:lipopolysaccharide export system permease protein